MFSVLDFFDDESFGEEFDDESCVDKICKDFKNVTYDTENLVYMGNELTATESNSILEPILLETETWPLNMPMQKETVQQEAEP
jgi:hypothetical protein